MIIDCIADLHGNYPKLEGGDLLIVAGDLTARDDDKGYSEFGNWINKQKYGKKIFICGNHDNQLQNGTFPLYIDGFSEYLCDSGTEFAYYPPLVPGSEEVFERKIYKIWGSPWTKTFEGMNPHCKAFTCDTEEELASKFSLIPEDTDILITHSPPYGILDKTIEGEEVGSISLAVKVGSMKKAPLLWVCGHIHEAYGQEKPIRHKPCKLINASHVNEHYQPVNKPIRVIL